MRFTCTSHTAATCTVAPGHTITRWLGWYRNGGNTYEFRCTCGWTAKAKSVAPLTNEVAIKHAQSL